MNNVEPNLVDFEAVLGVAVAAAAAAAACHQL